MTAAERGDDVRALLARIWQEAFACHAGEDREQVIACIERLGEIVGDLDVLLDATDAGSGSSWRQELERRMVQRQVFYLFWSCAASRSERVERAWRYALETRGRDFIAPVPLVSPREVPPPVELSDRNFDDWMLAYTRGSAGGHRGTEVVQ